MVSAPGSLIFGLSHRRARDLTFSWRALSDSFEKLFCTAGTGFLNDRFGRLIYAARLTPKQGVFFLELSREVFFFLRCSVP